MGKYKQISDGEFWADKGMDLANLGMVTLVFTQLQAKEINGSAVLFGIVLYAFLISLCRQWRRKG